MGWNSSFLIILLLFSVFVLLSKILCHNLPILLLFTFFAIIFLVSKNTFCCFYSYNKPFFNDAFYFFECANILCNLCWSTEQLPGCSELFSGLLSSVTCLGYCLFSPRWQEISLGMVLGLIRYSRKTLWISAYGSRPGNNLQPE